MKVLLCTYFIMSPEIRPNCFNIYNSTISHFPHIGKIRVKAPAPTEFQFSIIFSLTCSQPRGNKTPAHDFLFFKYSF